MLRTGLGTTIITFYKQGKIGGLTASFLYNGEITNVGFDTMLSMVSGLGFFF